jgi:hypothetical protein
MTLIYSNGLLQVFMLKDPPTGSKLIVATWSGSSLKAAVGGATSFNQVDSTTPYRLQAATGSNNAPTMSFIPVHSGGFVQDSLGVNTVPASTTATVGAGQTSLWDSAVGSGPSFTRTIGAGSNRRPSSATVTMSWSLSHSNAWYLAAVDLVPHWIQMFLDQEGEACPAEPFALTAADYSSLQEAVDALPDSGGTLLIPPGTYRLESTLMINKSSVTLIGAGLNSLIVPADPANNPIDLINVSAGLLRMSNLLVDGLAEAQDLEDGTSGIVFDGLGVSGRLVVHCFLENVVVQGTSKAGILLRDAIILTAINCEAISNLGDGVRIQGIETGATTLNFTNCSMSANSGIGAHIGDVDTPTAAINFLGCIFEGNQGEGYTLSDIGTGFYALQCAKVSLYSCYFEEAPEGCAQFVFFETSQNCVVDNCWFQGGGVPDRAVRFVTSVFSRFTSNTAEGFEEEIVSFDTNCKGCIEFANRDMDSSGVPRIVIDANAGVIGMSRNSIGLPRVASDSLRPTGTEVKEGSLIWVSGPTGNSKLQVWDGSAWKNITLT